MQQIAVGGKPFMRWRSRMLRRGWMPEITGYRCFRPTANTSSFKRHKPLPYSQIIAGVSGSRRDEIATVRRDATPDRATSGHHRSRKPRSMRTGRS
jgi:hypothetical protein